MFLQRRLVFHYRSTLPGHVMFQILNYIWLILLVYCIFDNVLYFRWLPARKQTRYLNLPLTRMSNTRCKIAGHCGTSKTRKIRTGKRCNIWSHPSLLSKTSGRMCLLLNFVNFRQFLSSVCFVLVLKWWTHPFMQVLYVARVFT